MNNSVLLTPKLRKDGLRLRLTPNMTQDSVQASKRDSKSIKHLLKCKGKLIKSEQKWPRTHTSMAQIPVSVSSRMVSQVKPMRQRTTFMTELCLASAIATSSIAMLMKKRQTIMFLIWSIQLQRARILKTDLSSPILNISRKLVTNSLYLTGNLKNQLKLRKSSLLTKYSKSTKMKKMKTRLNPSQS